ncbi:MAG: PA14 domain-containing protein [Anaerolineae bacterium]
MIRQLGSFVALTLLLALALPGTVAAQGPVTPEHSDPNWSAAYWNNTELAGAPVLVRSESNLNYNWGSGSPHPTISEDQFSTRWQRYVDVIAGTYRFTVTSDDGLRLWIDDELVLDEWNDHAEETFFVDHYLSAGHHLVTLEYYENQGVAAARLSWVRADQAVGRWRAEYHNYTSLAGQPVLVRNEAALDFNWGTGSPDPAVVNTDRFSARWYPILQPGRYEVRVHIPDRFSTTSRARYWIAHSDGLTLRVVDQSAASGGEWVSLGTYQFQGDGSEYVSLADITFELYLSRLIAFDAVQWLPQ